MLFLFTVTLNVTDTLWGTGPQESLTGKLLHSTIETTCSGESQIIDSCPCPPTHSAAPMLVCVWGGALVCVHVCGSYEKFTENVEYDSNNKIRKSLSLCNEFTSPVTLERNQKTGQVTSWCHRLTMGQVELLKRFDLEARSLFKWV